MGSVLWIDFLKASIMASKFVVFTAILVSFQEMDASKACPDLLKFKKISNQFPMYVAHGSHSLTLNDIQAFFKPNANEKNGISIVNFNLTDDDILLKNAPLIVLDKRFSSSALFALDHVLSHIEDNEYGIKNGNALDRVAHALHMQETWQNAAKIYKKLTKKRKPGKLLAKQEKTWNAICSCLDQVYGELISKSLLYIAKQIREPETMYATSGAANNTRRVPPPYRGNYGGGCCSDDPWSPWSPWSTDLMVPREPGQQIRSRSTKEEAIPNIVDEETWESWKDMTYAKMDENLKNELAYNFAHFMYCKLN